ncbi:MAG TPA: ATP-binding cassette domain-containing protein [Gemmatimonadaceae bacterium]|nr:ATP-binding cassette domain-containing protein [Gemmatimonadaceae bacterium]
MALLEGRNLRKTYRLGRRNTVEALRGVNISIGAGEMVAIMGPSGSGKSTLMHLLGLLHSPDRNGGAQPEVLVDGRSVANLSDRERTRLRASTMGFVFQAFNLVPTLTALENVALAGEYAGMKRGQANELAREALDCAAASVRYGEQVALQHGGCGKWWLETKRGARHPPGAALPLAERSISRRSRLTPHRARCASDSSRMQSKSQDQ